MNEGLGELRVPQALFYNQTIRLCAADKNGLHKE